MPDSYENALDPDAILQSAPELVRLPYDEAVSNLKKIYSDNTWTDKELAAQNTAQLADLINKANNKEYSIDLGADLSPAFAAVISPNLEEEDKLRMIEETRTKFKEGLYMTDDVDSLFTAHAKEKIADDLIDQMRRGVITADEPLIKDMMARGAEAALAPLVGTGDLLFGTNYTEDFRKAMAEHQDPDWDDTLLAGLSSIGGGVVGFAGASFNPVSAWGYLGATIASQSKDVYDAAYNETGSHEAAKEAWLKSTPGILFGTFADRIVGGSLGKSIRGEKGFLGAIPGAITGASGAAVQALATGEALAQATGEDKFRPSAESVVTQAAAGGVVGAAIGAIGEQLSGYRQRAKIEKEMARAAASTDEAKAQVDAMPDSIPRPFESETVTPNDRVVGQIRSTFKNREKIPPPGAEDEVLRSFVHDPEQEPVLADATEGVLADATLQSTDAPGNYTKILPATRGNPQMSPVIAEWARQLVSSLTTQDTKEWGFFDPADNRLNVSRRAFANPEQANSTLAHEFGHVVDQHRLKLRGYRGVMNLETPIGRFVQTMLQLKNQLNVQKGEQEARELSAAWRPGWDGKSTGADLPPGTPRGVQKYYDYRNQPWEIVADNYSAIFLNPKFVQDNFPTVWKAFNAGIDELPVLRKFWDEYLDISNSPQKTLDWFTKVRHESRLKESEIVGTSAEARILEKGKAKAISPGVLAARQRLLNARAPFDDIIATLRPEVSPAELEQLYTWYRDTYAIAAGRTDLRVYFDVPIRRITDRFQKLGIDSTVADPLAPLKDYMFNDHIINDTTVTMDAIVDSPEPYIDAAVQLKAMLPELEKMQPEEARGRKLLKQLALIKSQLKPQQRAKITGQLHAALAKPKPNQRVDWMPYAIELLDDGAFAARRFLATAGANEDAALRNLSVMQARYGSEKFTALQETSNLIHEALMNPMLDAAEKAGLFPERVLKRMRLNKRSYAYANVLKYFDNDPHIKGTVYEKVGSLHPLGDELAATISKVKAVYLYASHQIAQNAALNLAARGRYTVVPMPYKGRPVNEERLLKQKQNPDKSYLIGRRNGDATLYEIDSPAFRRVFEKSWLDNAPETAWAFDFMDKFNKFFGEREFKTTLSPLYLARTFFMDTRTEAILAKSWELASFLPFHLSRMLRKMKSAARRTADKAIYEGELTGDAAILAKYHALPIGFADDMGGWSDPNKSAEGVIYELMGKPIPGEENMYVPGPINRNLNKLLTKAGFGKDSGVRSILNPVKVNNALNRAANKIGLGKVRKLAEREETATKLTAFRIAKEIHKMGDAEAATFADKHAGVPDPYGGGIEATAVGKMFLFGRAMLNGMRNEYNLVKDDPRGMGMMYMYHKGIPRLLTSSALFAPLVGALWGEEAEQETRKFLDKIPEFDKISKFIIPVGWIDDKGGLRWSAKASEINTDWKPVYIRMPYSRELVTYDRIVSVPFKALEDLVETGTISAKKIGADAVGAFSAIFSGNIAPAIQWAVRTSQFATYQNPYDFYRKRGIFPKDVAEAGTLLDRFYRYATWSMANTYPGFFSFSPEQIASTDLTSPHQVIAITPVLGRFIGMSNYGEYEKQRELAGKKAEFDANIRLHMGSDTKKLYNEYAKAQSYVTNIGAGWQKQTAPLQQARIRAVQNWHSRAYKYAFNELRAAYEKGDEEAVKRISEKLEKSSSTYLNQINR